MLLYDYLVRYVNMFLIKSFQFELRSLVYVLLLPDAGAIWMDTFIPPTFLKIFRLKSVDGEFYMFIFPILWSIEIIGFGVNLWNRRNCI